MNSQQLCGTQFETGTRQRTGSPALDKELVHAKKEEENVSD
jgi:hypothetical protein